MTTAATLDTNLTLNSTAFRQGMIQAAQTANTSLKSIQAQAQQTATILSTLNKAVAAFGAFEALKEGLGALVEAQVKLQSIQYTLLSATGNTIAAGESMQFLREESEKLGLSLPDTAEGFARLAAAASASGVSMTAQQGLFDAFAKASSTLHLSTAQSGRALLALQEMFSRGTITARQLNQQLGQAVPGSAIRFQQAVLAMTKGTDLQGKSFEQLLKGGKLITTQFLPALTAALQQSGQGWEQASTGLNANLNRLSTAWFNLKTDLSGGLFSDTLSGGAALLAQNLNKVAAALQLVAGVAAARGLSSLLGKGIGAVTGSVGASFGNQILASTRADISASQAAATVAATQAYRAEAQSLVDVDAKTIALLRDQKLLAQATRETAAAAFEAAAQQDLAARQNVARMGNAAPLSGNIAFSAQQAEVAAAAQIKLTQAQLAFNQASARAQGILVQEQAAQNSLSASRAVLTAATEEATVAQVALTEAQGVQAATNAFAGLGGMIAKAGASLGSFALALVGGPWGAAVLAVGALVYAFESAKSEAEHLEVQTKENAKAVEDLVKQAYDLQQAFKEVGNAEPFAKLKDSSDTLGAALLKNQQDLETARAKLAEMDALHVTATEHVGSLAFAYQIWRDQLNHTSGVYDATKASVDQLTDASASLTAAYSGANATAVEAYGHNWDDVRDALIGVQFTIPSLEKALDGLQSKIDKAMSLDAVVDNARKKVDEYQNAITNAAEASAKKLRQKSMTEAQRAADDLAQAQKAAIAGRTGGLSPEAEAAAKENIANLKGIEAAEAAKKAASAAASAAAARAREAADLLVSQQGELAAAKAQLDQTDKMVPAQKQLNEELGGGVKAYNGMTAAQKALSIATLKQAAALQEQFIANEKARKSAEAYAAMKENLDRVLENSRQQIADDMAALSGQGAQETADARALEAFRRSYTERQRLIDKNKELTVADAQAATADNKKELDQQLADYLAFEKTRADAQYNAMNGMKAAIADFIEAQNNMAALAQQFTGDFISQFSDAFANFASGTESAKKAFGDFIDSMYKEAWKFVADQTIKSLLLSINAPGTEGQPGAGKGFFANLKSSLFGTFSGQGNPMATAQVTATTSNTAALIALTEAISTMALSGGLGGTGGLGGLAGIFGSMFDSGNGAGGMFGGLGGLFSSPSGDIFQGLGGLAGGGTAGPRSLHRVAENGPELLDVGDQAYLMMGSRGGHVTPTEQLATRAGNVTNITNVSVHPTTTRRTAQQVATAINREQRIATARNS